ncbi:MAG: type II secretion system protein GspE [Zetaproteobacteria bacterium]|nr:type II secretion system protein GspE [Pseudobdellovibrionaceae bacterium]
MSEEDKSISNLKNVTPGQRPFRDLQKKPLGEVLIKTGTITQDQLDDALQAQKTSYGKRLGDILVEKEYVTEDEMLKSLAIQLDLPYYDRLPVAEIDPELVENIPIQFCRDHLILPIARDSFNITVAVADPLNIFPMDDLRLILSANINMVVSTPNVINNTINRVYERAQDASQKAIDALNVSDIDSSEDLEEAKDLLEASNDDKPIIRLVNSLLARAVKERVSDVHIEPFETEVIVRFRIDGTLHEAMQVPKRHVGAVVSRIKIIGKLNIAEKRIPQDGRISIKVAGKDIDVRLSILPTSHGERVVMRLLDKSAGVRRLEEMGMDDWTYRAWTALVQQKHGIVLVTGPTGSGKSSLLYASVLHINEPDINIMTVEDPVEYTLAGLGQIDVKSKIGLTFSAALRSILRQDPDVIMIGEIRDNETAKIAVESSLTGHLVFSTLHTNDAASTITRLDDLDIEPFQIASALLGVMATRLIRRLCEQCKEEHTPTEEEMKLMEITPKDIKGKKIYKVGSGCEHCFQSGYSGRTPIHELLVLDDPLRELLMTTQDSSAIRKLALKNGMKTLRISAVRKVLEGITSIEEAISTTQTEDLEM